MRNLKLILMAGFSVVALTHFAPLKAKTASPVTSFGACYTLFNCQGGSIGTYDDMQCRNLGGHSINSGGICFNL